MDPCCRVCQSQNLAPLEPYPRVLVANGRRTTWQNHRCEDCRATTCVRTFADVSDVDLEDSGEVPPRASKQPRKAARRR